MALVLSPQEKTQVGRRSALEVTMSVLSATSGGPAKPTHIMYRSNTSWTVLQRNLESLISSGFMRQTGSGYRLEYAITESGLAVLRDYARLLERTNSTEVTQ